MKICSKCKKEKKEKEFYKDKRNKTDGLRCWCKSCSLKDNSSREEKYIGKRKEYRENNKDKISQSRRIYYVNHREHILKTNANYRTSLHYKFISYKRSADSRNIKWELTKDDFEELWNVNCYYCNNDIPTIGIDRVSLDDGYNKNNIVPCCSLCNTIKWDLSYDEFISQIEKIYKKLIKKSC